MLAVHETPTAYPKPRLLDRVRDAIRARHYSRRTEDAYVGWIRRYIFFHGKRHPAEMARHWQAEGAQRLHVVDLDGARDGVRANAGVVAIGRRAFNSDGGNRDCLRRAAILAGAEPRQDEHSDLQHEVWFRAAIH